MVPTTLTEQIAAVHSGRATPDELLSAFRSASLVVAMESPTAATTVRDQGLTWVCAFTSTTRLAEFAAARGEGEREWSFRVLTGAELTESSDAGVAVDLGSAAPMLFPPRP
jgi:hypothetical protein